MKKILATILALVLALGLCSVSWADSEATVNSCLLYTSDAADEL